MARVSEVEEKERHPPSPTELSRKSADSGFSDSDCGQRHGGERLAVGPASRLHERLPSVSSYASSTGSLGELRRRALPQALQRAPSASSLASTRSARSSPEPKGSLEDLSMLPEPNFSSTPKSKANNDTEYDIQQLRCPVNAWLSEVRHWCDPECMSTLQNKPIMGLTNERVARSASNAVSTIRYLHQQLRAVCDRLTALYRRIKNKNLRMKGQLLERIVKRMEKILMEHEVKVKEKFDCGGLLLAFETLEGEGEIPNLVAIIKSIAILFAKNVEERLIHYISILVDILNDERSPASLSLGLSSLASLEMDVPYLADLLAACDGISSMLLILVDSRSASVRTATLNLLATTACTRASIAQFEKSGGLDIVCDIITSRRRGEAEQCAAVSLLSQITGPWLDVTVRGISAHMDILIPSITRLIENQSTTEMLMMCASALANVSGVEPLSIPLLVRCHSPIILLRSVRLLGTKASVFVKEQAAILLANISAHEAYLKYLRQNRVVPALLCFIQPTLSPLIASRERAAMFRLQHKAIIALSRICSDSGAARQVVDLHGVTRIVRLCHDEKERNCNDGVLVACLVALRKVVEHCGLDVVEALNASDLVEPNLLESFLLCSSNHGH